MLLLLLWFSAWRNQAHLSMVNIFLLLFAIVMFSASRRNQAAEWLRQMDHGASGVLSKEPSEEEFCLSLRNGLILCNVLNKVNPGAVLKVIHNILFNWLHSLCIFWVKKWSSYFLIIGGGESNCNSSVSRRSCTICNPVFWEHEKLLGGS